MQNNNNSQGNVLRIKKVKKFRPSQQQDPNSVNNG
jgi:hypothetical protein